MPATLIKSCPKWRAQLNYMAGFVDRQTVVVAKVLQRAGIDTNVIDDRVY